MEQSADCGGGSWWGVIGKIKKYEVHSLFVPFIGILHEQQTASGGAGDWGRLTDLLQVQRQV